MPQKPNSGKIKMTIHNEAEEKGTNKAYQEMYKKYGALSYSEAYDIICDVMGILETKCILGLDKAKLNEHELGALITEAKEIEKLAEASEQALKVRLRYNLLTKSEK